MLPIAPRRMCLVTAALATVVMTACNGDAPTPAPTTVSAPTTASPAPTTTTLAPTTTTAAALPASPSRHPGELAAQLNRAVEIFDDPGSGEDALESAGRLQQVAFGRLGSDEALDASVRLHLSPRAASSLDAFMAASSGLSGLVSPQADLPDWEILEPEPPELLLAYYDEAHRASGVEWTYLAAIHFVESRMGRIRGLSPAGARGPMQFIPTTWDIYGEGDIDSNRDAILAAARLLAASGAPSDMYSALYSYNPAAGYVAAVEAYAGQMRHHPREYLGYHQWQVFYRHVSGTLVLPVGYPAVAPQPLPS